MMFSSSTYRRTLSVYRVNTQTIMIRVHIFASLKLLGFNDTEEFIQKCASVALNFVQLCLDLDLLGCRKERRLIYSYSVSRGKHS